MGFALAEAARQRGADVTVIAGFTTVTPPPGLVLVNTSSAAEMHAEVMKAINKASIFIAAAAVADYRPVSRVDTKIKKSHDRLNLTLERTKDILGEVAKTRRNGQLVVGFAAETENVIANARGKLIRKGLDLLVANDVTQNGAGFDTPTNIITILSSDTDKVIELPLMSKKDAAHRILDEVVRRRTLKSSSASPNSSASS